MKIQQKSSGDAGEKRKMFMYSGHDFSILFTTAALGHLMETPKFGSSLHFHVYRFNNTDEDVIKVNFFCVELFYIVSKKKNNTSMNFISNRDRIQYGFL